MTATVRPAVGSYFRSRGAALGLPVFVILAMGIVGTMWLLSRDPGSLVIGLMVLGGLLGLGLTVAIALRRAVIEVHTQGIVLSGGFTRRAHSSDQIGRIVFMTANYGEAQRREMRILNRQGQRLDSVVAELFDPTELSAALAGLNVHVENT